MGVLETLKKLRANYPGGWQKYARGYEGYKSPPFTQANDPDDRRTLIPPMGLKEYWYPAMPDKDVKWNKPIGMKMLGEELVFWRDKNGQVQALWDYCPHRGVYLSLGDCFWKGYISCPYHGATFDGDGECVEFITEGPDSKMVGRMKAKKYPTVTLKGVVFVWMGEGEPSDPKEDIPEEFFDDDTVIRNAWNYWHCNWMIALENTYDSHNAFLVHRNSIFQLRNRYGGRPRTPMGYRAKIIDNKTVVLQQGAESYYAKDGKTPYQMYYPRVGGYWPLHRWRLLWTWFTEPMDRRKLRRPKFRVSQNWEGQHLPSILRISHYNCFYTRWCVPVDENLTRVMYLCSYQPTSLSDRIYRKLTWPIHNWVIHFNFSDQDYDAMRTARYQYPEYLSSTDSYMVLVRKNIVENGRGINRSVEIPKETTAEKLVYQFDEELGVKPMTDAFESELTPSRNDDD